jgi:hypothetical protein
VLLPIIVAYFELWISGKRVEKIARNAKTAKRREFQPTK